MDIEQMAATATNMGILGLDLVKPEDWAAVKKHGLVATMVSGAGGIKSGLNDKSRHPQFLDDFRNNIQAAADAGGTEWLFRRDLGTDGCQQQHSPRRPRLVAADGPAGCRRTGTDGAAFV